ncbi:hypothetical protein [Leptospira borgpetersenii]|uniref:Uncharacterized protein n=1 Tax=Leptospira borgpetersenii serovar Ballum TaxID=280505 RepID=A0A0E3AYY1_LEPBO|nr:hypothetical protein [Leptospira borgpetersenii]ALO27269.1 hypothetical protein LBBP_03060 [Leptospira borgpetersenii serovar Ballum]ANH01655.1 Uncharacterized protein LB4E_2407 [Leptospira borgpetersenii str. 4E]EKQ99971.1 hypothetical protein LEP1GSC121_2231 [Leptospira borgpetersenii serovar Castellonis str. 200801910]KGE22692.1 hypothetical protein IQ66_14990 [Leptospira borgpetersenii serovar Ballum]MBE8160273.1 hypothetical protein [Leptospira borgpetersenii serovar Ballum]
MKKMKTNGTCAYCREEIQKNSGSIKAHISKCDSKNKSKKNKTSHHMLLLIEGKYNPEYWLVIKAKADTSLKKIDSFIRDIWVECCGHLSAFTVESGDIEMEEKIGQVFEEGFKVDYIYDFGSSTELSLSLIDEIEDGDEKDIKIIFRNKDVDFKCYHCHNKAEMICPFCIHNRSGLLCKSCIKNHECVEEEGEDLLLPLVNSPRVGECAYSGYQDKYVKKYFPKEIF